MAILDWRTSPLAAEALHFLACHGPADVNTVARALDCHRNSVAKIFREARGIVHVWRYARAHARDRGAMKIWAIGPGEDATPERYGRTDRHMGNWETAESAARILARLTCGDCEVKTLAADCHLSESVVRGQLRQMVPAVVHVGAYRRTTGFGGMYAKVFRLGPGRAPAKPKPATKSENYRAWRERKIARFGRETAMSMLRSRNAGGAETIARDGRVVYRRLPSKAGVKRAGL